MPIQARVEPSQAAQPNLRWLFKTGALILPDGHNLIRFPDKRMQN